jgi:hypothetical protein
MGGVVLQYFEIVVFCKYFENGWGSIANILKMGFTFSMSFTIEMCVVIMTTISYGNNTNLLMVNIC